jgi:hypothetical protein
MLLYFVYWVLVLKLYERLSALQPLDPYLRDTRWQSLLSL